ncbi:MAG: YqaJ viral recombinase family protein, partial [Porticoccaceae bacterium]
MAEIHDLIQGAPEWHLFRAEHFGASEAAAMLGVSPYKTRHQLLREKATGVTPEVSEHTQRIFDHGHEVEALARPIIEADIGEELFQVTMSDGKISASCDGLTVLGDTAWEHKQWNQALAESVRAGILPEEHKPQCQQVLMVTGAERLIFTVSDGTRQNMVSMEVLPDPEYQAKIRAGWAQFERDLAEHKPEAPAVEVVAQAQESLPAVYA